MQQPENRLPEDELPHEGPLEALPHAGEAPVEARGLGWVLVPTGVAGLFGAAIGLVMGTKPGPPRLSLLDSAIQGGVVGAIVGGVIGVFIWVAFPYKSSPPPPPEPGADEEKQGQIL